ncbi:MAG: hypothetical protein ABIG20_00370, partial [archaeon]
DPSRINCGSDCTEFYDSGKSSTLTAYPSSGSKFIGWSGDCSGTGICKVTMDKARTVTATYSKTTNGSNEVKYTCCAGSSSSTAVVKNGDKSNGCNSNYPNNYGNDFSSCDFSWRNICTDSASNKDCCIEWCGKKALKFVRSEGYSCVCA